MTSLAVNEMFGPTLQGEGPSAGRRAWFLRLAGCNLRCTWCDTPQTWDGSRFDLRAETRRLTVDEIIDSYPADMTGLFVVTGGEPMLQATGLSVLFNEMPWSVAIELETNGLIAPPVREWPFVRFNVSPKLHNSGACLDLHPEWLTDHRARLKFVVTGLADLDEISMFPIEPHRVWIMPEGTTADRTLEVARAVADAVIERGWNLTLRQHVLLWGNERGR